MAWLVYVPNRDICWSSVVNIHYELELNRKWSFNYLKCFIPAVYYLKVKLEVAVNVNLVVVALWEGSYPKSFPVERSISLKVNLKP